MRRVSLLFPFFLALVVALFGGTVYPHLKLIAFAPFLAFLYSRMSLPQSLWIATLCGLIYDLLSSEFIFGLHAINYSLTTLVCYKQKRHFADKALALCLYTLLISTVYSLLQVLLICIFDRGLPLSGKWALTDLLLMPLADSVYAWIWFHCPIRLYLHLKKVGMRRYCQRIINLFLRRQENAP